jgi:DNA-3-methyladenine glycosylase II
MNKLRLTARGPYSLAASARFLCGFTPGSGGACAAPGGALALGFLEDETFAPVVVRLEQRGAYVVGASSGPPVARQVARILCLDRDARGFGAIEDPVIARLIAENDGFRPPCFPSPYEAAVWGVLAQRTPMAVAAGLKRRLAEATGACVEAFGQSFHPSPPPEPLLAITSFAGISAEKLARLHAVARAALDGKLNAGRLRAMERERALSDLCTIRGVGAWTAQHILLRGAGEVDVLAVHEPRVLEGARRAYGRELTPDALAAIAVGWRPYRTWVSVLLVMSLRGSRVPAERRRRAGASRVRYHPADHGQPLRR